MKNERRMLHINESENTRVLVLVMSTLGEGAMALERRARNAVVPALSSCGETQKADGGAGSNLTRRLCLCPMLGFLTQEA